jgi:hypothetical protein
MRRIILSGARKRRWMEKVEVKSEEWEGGSGK